MTKPIKIGKLWALIKAEQMDGDHGYWSGTWSLYRFNEAPNPHLDASGLTGMVATGSTSVMGSEIEAKAYAELDASSREAAYRKARRS